MAESSITYDQNVAENIWQLKSGIRQGMSLYQLRKLNDAAFDFNGGNSAYTGMVATANSGKLDFKKEIALRIIKKITNKDKLEDIINFEIKRTECEKIIDDILIERINSFFL